MSLEVPGQIRVNVQCIPGPNALPASLNNQGPGFVEIIQVGGITKLEYVATQLVAAAVASQSLAENSVIQDVCGEKMGIRTDVRSNIEALVHVAKMTLECCEAAAKEAAARETPPTPQIG